MVTKQTKNSPYPQTKALPRSCDLQKYLRGIDFYIKLWGGGLISMASQENNKVALRWQNLKKLTFSKAEALPQHHDLQKYCRGLDFES